MAGAESVITRIDAVEQNLSRATSVISVRAAIAAALDRRFPGADAVRIALEHEPAGSHPRRGRAN
jgi:hypothetical protein